MKYPHEGRIIGAARTRDFWSLAWALSVASEGDIDFANSKIAYVNEVHAQNMKDLEERHKRLLAGGPKSTIRASSVPEYAYAPVKIIEAFQGDDRRIHFRFSIPGSDLIGTFPVDKVASDDAPES